MMIATECLDKETFSDLIAGRLSQRRLADVLQHVDSCSRCAELETDESDEALCELVKLFDSRSHRYSEETHCLIAIGNELIRASESERTREEAYSPFSEIGPYRILRQLGAGGMGAVYLAEHQRLKRTVAIKLLHRDKLQRPGWLDRFNREMMAVAALEHPNVVRAMDAGETDGWHYLVMESLEGLDLGQLVRRMPDVSVGIACEIIRQAALGLAAIHEKGLVHRDIKPSNIFVGANGVIKLLDLGLVLDGDAPLGVDERLTTVGHMMGTLPYMAREQLSDARNVDARTDIYALGASLCRLLTGSAPFGNLQHIPTLIQAISHQESIPMAERRVDLRPELSQIIDRMLSHEPATRPSTALKVAELLQPFCSKPSDIVSLVQIALQHPVTNQDTVFESQRPAIATAPNKPPRNSYHWLAWAFLPFAFGAGVLLTLVTDNGSLTIETDQPKVGIRVMRGAADVRELVVERNKPSILRLRSGTYAIEVTGVDAEQYLVSENRIAITRGDRELLVVTKKYSKSDATATAGNGMIYEGKDSEQWLDILRTDRDLDKLGEAMKALSAIAASVNPEGNFKAARAMLAVAREYGPLALQSQTPLDIAKQADRLLPQDTERFMAALSQAYPVFFDEPGIRAISEEFRDGNTRSWQACVMLLTTGKGEKYFAKNVGDELALNLYENLTLPIKKLSNQDDDRERNSRSYLVQFKNDLAQRLGKEKIADPQIEDNVRRQIASAEDILNAAPQENSIIAFPLTAVQCVLAQRLIQKEERAGFVNAFAAACLLEPKSEATDSILAKLFIENPAGFASGAEFALSQWIAIRAATSKTEPGLSDSAEAASDSRLFPSSVESLVITALTQHHPDAYGAFIRLASAIEEEGEFLPDKSLDWEVLFAGLVDRSVQQIGAMEEDSKRMIYWVNFVNALGRIDDLIYPGGIDEEIIRKLLSEVATVKDFDAKTPILSDPLYRQSYQLDVIAKRGLDQSLTDNPERDFVITVAHLLGYSRYKYDRSIVISELEKAPNSVALQAVYTAVGNVLIGAGNSSDPFQ